MNSEKESDKEKGQSETESELEKGDDLAEDELTEEEEERAKKFLKELGYM